VTLRTHYPTIVLGCGGAGSAALYWLARRAGGEVLGIEQYPLFHGNGGSQDHSRIIRLAYHDTRYAQLAPHAYEAWAVLADESGVNPVRLTGGVIIAGKESPYAPVVEEYAAAMDAAGVQYERLTADELRYRFPQFTPQEDIFVLYQARTGLVNPNYGTASHVALARLYGATILDKLPVLEVIPGDGEVAVVTAEATFTCANLVVTAGAWTGELTARMGAPLPIVATQEQVTYYATPHTREFIIGRFPIFQWKHDESIYGFPLYNEVATKAAIDASGPQVTPATRTFTPDPVREARLHDFLAARIPRFVGPTLYTKTCLYALTPDRDFVLDALPQHPNIFVFVGAGHGYKFAGLVGRILSELALDGATQYDIGAFSLNRPALTQPDDGARRLKI
jgi:sarcosine oxidase